MKWKKCGHIFHPKGDLDWSQSHAQLPIAEWRKENNTIRVYYSTRDDQGRSRPGYIEVSSDNPADVSYVHNVPLMDLGKPGAFDDCGVMPSWIIDHDGKKLMYYIGWNVRNTIPYHNAVGLAVSVDGGNTFTRFSEGPLWDRNYVEPHYSGTSCILIDDDGKWKNWYLSCTEWREVNGRMEPRYHIKYAESLDGINWNRHGTIAVDYKDNDEGGIVKASVIKEYGVYKMWYSFRRILNYRVDSKQSYRIGYAESKDGIKWLRKDHLTGIDLSPDGWDSEMIAYPHVLDVGDKRLLFYNGNEFGKSGFGYAELIRK